MKKSFLPLLFIFAIFSMSARAQTVTIPENFEGVPGQQVSIPVTVDTDGQEICSFDFEIHYDNSVLEFIEVTGFGGGGSLDADDEAGDSPLKIGWNSTDQNTGITPDDGEVLLYIVFDYEGQSSTLNFEDPNTYGASALTDCSVDNVVVEATFNNGSIIPVSAPVPVSKWALMIGFGLMVVFVVLRIVKP